jgi:hypothetical protein
MPEPILSQIQRRLCEDHSRQMVDSGLDVTVKCVDEREDYWDKNEYQRKKEFTKWINANLPGMKARNLQTGQASPWRGPDSH